MSESPHLNEHDELWQKARRNWWVRRGLFGAGVLVLVLTIGLSLWVNTIWQAAFSESCERVPLVDLSIKDIVKIRRRSQAYRKSVDPRDYLEVSDKEISFLMRDMYDFDLWVEFQGSDIHAKVAYPIEHGCYNIDFHGRVRVDDGRVLIQFDKLVMGEFLADSWVAGRTVNIGPEDLGGGLDEAVIRALYNTQSIEIVNSNARVQLKDRSELW